MHWDSVTHTPSSGHQGQVGCWDIVTWTQYDSDQCHPDTLHSTGHQLDSSLTLASYTLLTDLASHRTVWLRCRCIKSAAILALLAPL